MTRHNNMMGSFWAGIAIGTGALLIAEQLWRVLVPNENGLSIDTGNSINKNDYFSTELDEYNDDSVAMIHQACRQMLTIQTNLPSIIQNIKM